MLELATAALSLAAIAGTQPSGEEHSANQRDVQLCEFRWTEIILNSLGGPAARSVSERELAWARKQEQRAEHGEPCDPSPGMVDAAAHNAAFEAVTKWGLTPQTTDERLLCAAVWNRWNYAVESAADPLFVSALRPELSAANAASRELFWRDEAVRQLDDAAEVVRLGKGEAQAEEKADALYAAYANGEQSGLGTLMEYLAICR